MTTLSTETFARRNFRDFSNSRKFVREKSKNGPFAKVYEREKSENGPFVIVRENWDIREDFPGKS